MTNANGGEPQAIKYAGTVVSVETAGKLLSVQQRIQGRVGKTMLPIEALPLGNSYCLYCTAPCFVLPEKGVSPDLPDFCTGCDDLFAMGVL